MQPGRNSEVHVSQHKAHTLEQRGIKEGEGGSVGVFWSEYKYKELLACCLMYLGISLPNFKGTNTMPHACRLLYISVFVNFAKTTLLKKR